MVAILPDSITAETAPYFLPESNNSKLLEFLKPLPFSTIKSQSIPAVVGTQVPVFKSIDVSNLIEKTSNRLIWQTASERRRDDARSTSEELENPENEIEEDPQHFVEIQELLPKSLKDQLSLVVVDNFPNVKQYAIEKIVDSLVDTRKYKWSHVHYEFADNRLVYIRFEHVPDAKWFVDTYSLVLPDILLNKNIKVIHNNHIDEVLDELSDFKADPKSTVNSKVVSKIGSILKNKRNFERISKRSGTEDLDEVLAYYSKYEVDSNDLIDVPTNMREAIVKDIVRFRSKVLLIERDNRKKEIELEREKTKDRLKKLFAGLKETNDDINMDSETTKDLPSNIVNEYDDLSDDEYEELLKTGEKKKLDKLYQDKSHQLQSLETRERLYLTKKLEDLNNYEDDLINNKIKYIEDFKNIEESTNSNNNDISSLVSLYFNNHAQYLKVRNHKRSAEEALDAKDEDDEKKEELSTKSQDFVLLKKAKNTLEKDTEDAVPVADNAESETEPSRIEVDVSIAKLSKEQTSKLQSKIVELVEEYLGIVDEFLVEVINENLNKHNLSAKDELMEELSEVLDDDSANLVNDLWNYVSTIAI